MSLLETALTQARFCQFWYHTMYQYSNHLHQHFQARVLSKYYRDHTCIMLQLNNRCVSQYLLDTLDTALLSTKLILHQGTAKLEIMYDTLLGWKYCTTGNIAQGHGQEANITQGETSVNINACAIFSHSAQA